MAQSPPNIAPQQRAISRLLRQRDFNKFSDNLAKILTDIWLTAGKVGVSQVKDYLTGTAAFGTGDLDDIIEILGDTLSGDFGDNIAPIVRGSVGEIYSRGQREISVAAAKSFNLVDRRSMRWLHEHHMFWSLNHYDSHVTGRIRNLAEVAMKNGLSRRDAGIFFENTIGKELVRDQRYWELTADAITTRSRSFGSIEAFQKARVTRYRVDAVIDHRTSTICRYLDGREVKVLNPDTGEVETFKLDDPSFNVSDGVELRDKLVDAKTPEEAKEISPWMNENKLAKGLLTGDFKTTSEMIASGQFAPPFHGNCRSRLVME